MRTTFLKYTRDYLWEISTNMPCLCGAFFFFTLTTHAEPVGLGGVGEAAVGVELGGAVLRAGQ